MIQPQISVMSQRLSLTPKTSRKKYKEVPPELLKERRGTKLHSNLGLSCNQFINELFSIIEPYLICGSIDKYKPSVLPQITDVFPCPLNFRQTFHTIFTHLNRVLSLFQVICVMTVIYNCISYEAALLSLIPTRGKRSDIPPFEICI